MCYVALPYHLIAYHLSPSPWEVVFGWWDCSHTTCILLPHQVPLTPSCPVPPSGATSSAGSPSLSIITSVTATCPSHICSSVGSWVPWRPCLTALRWAHGAQTLLHQPGIRASCSPGWRFGVWAWSLQVWRLQAASDCTVTAHPKPQAHCHNMQSPLCSLVYLRTLTALCAAFPMFVYALLYQRSPHCVPASTPLTTPCTSPQPPEQPKRMLDNPRSWQS